MSAIRVLLADDHDVVVRGLESTLESDDGIVVVGLAGDGEDALAQAARLAPDVIVMDIEMPGSNGIETTRALRRGGSDVRIIIFSMYDNEEFIADARTAGANAYVLKTDNSAFLPNVIRSVMQGYEVFPPEKPNKPDGAGSQVLTPREIEILKLLISGLTSQKIADRLHRSVNTINNHRKNILKKLDCSRSTSLETRAVELGLIPPPRRLPPT